MSDLSCCHRWGGQHHFREVHQGSCFSGRTFGHESVSVNLSGSEPSVLFSSNFCHRLEVLSLEEAIPSRNLRCSSLVHLPLVLWLFSWKSYIFESFEGVLVIIYNNFHNLNVAYPPSGSLTAI